MVRSTSRAFTSPSTKLCKPAWLPCLQTAQKFGSKKTFTATLSNRTETTYKEAEAFSVELKHALKQIRALQTATAGVWRPGDTTAQPGCSGVAQQIPSVRTWCLSRPWGRGWLLNAHSLPCLS